MQADYNTSQSNNRRCEFKLQLLTPGSHCIDDDDDDDDDDGDGDGDDDDAAAAAGDDDDDDRWMLKGYRRLHHRQLRWNVWTLFAFTNSVCFVF